jgi:two-component system LytT family response regulator
MSFSAQLVIPTSHGFEVVKVNSIIFLQASGSYCDIFLEDDERRLVSFPLCKLEDMLNEEPFFRIHKSTIINLRHVQSYRNGSECLITLSEGHKVKISRYKKADFMEHFKSLDFNLSL